MISPLYLEFIQISDSFPLFFDFDIEEKRIFINGKEYMLIRNERQFKGHGLTEYVHTFQDVDMWEQDKHNTGKRHNDT